MEIQICRSIKRQQETFEIYYYEHLFDKLNETYLSWSLMLILLVPIYQESDIISRKPLHLLKQTVRCKLKYV